MTKRRLIIGGVAGFGGAALVICGVHTVKHIKSYLDSEDDYEYEIETTETDYITEEEDRIEVPSSFAKPDLSSIEFTEAEHVDYTKMVEESYPMPELESLSELDTGLFEPKKTLPEIEPYTDDMTGYWFRISEDKYRNENPFYERRVATYFKNDRILGGYDEKLDPIGGELLRRVYTTIEVEHEDIDDLYFENPEEEVYIEVIVSVEDYESARKDAEDLEE